MHTLYKILVLILLAAAGFILIPLMVNLIIWAGMLNSETVPEGFLKDMIQKSSFVWLGSIAIGIISLFIEQKWRIIFLLCPLILPPLFTFFYTIMQS